MKASRRDPAPAGTGTDGLLGTPVSATPFCPVCGEDAGVHGTPVQRFGETLCSDAHADVFVADVRTQRAHAATVSDAAHSGHDTGAAGGGSAWKTWGLRALCWGGPLLAVVLLLGGGSTLLGVGGAILPYLALLACPVAMFFMMRSMGGTQQPPAQPPVTERKRLMPQNEFEPAESKEKP